MECSRFTDLSKINEQLRDLYPENSRVIVNDLVLGLVLTCFNFEDRCLTLQELAFIKNTNLNALEVVINGHYRERLSPKLLDFIWMYTMPCQLHSILFYVGHYKICISVKSKFWTQKVHQVDGLSLCLVIRIFASFYCFLALISLCALDFSERKSSWHKVSKSGVSKFSMIYRVQICCCVCISGLRWPNTVFKCQCLIHHYF